MSVTTMLPAVICIAIAFVMLHIGILCDPATARQQFASSDHRRAFLGLAMVNYLVIPGATLLFIRLFPGRPDLNLVLLTLAALPCAPLVPALTNHSGEAPEWPLLVFLGFSVLSLLALPLLMAVLSLPWIAGTFISSSDGLGLPLVKYVVSVYGPLMLGIAIRFLFPAWSFRSQPTFRKIAALSLLLAFVAFIAVNHNRLVDLSVHDFLAMSIFEFLCLACAFALGRHYGGPPVTRVLATALRNFAMALAFSTVVFAHTDASVYIIAFTTTTTIIVVVSIAVMKYRA